MKELSVFVDESGDFGEYDYHAPFYIISLVFHDQSKDISSDVIKFEEMMANIGWPQHCIHAGPIIRAEEDYKSTNLNDRKHILMKMMTFARHLDIKYRTIFIEKKAYS